MSSNFSIILRLNEWLCKLYFILCSCSKDIVANVSEHGVMSINYVGTASFGLRDWNKVINMPAYKLSIEVSNTALCLQN